MKKIPLEIAKVAVVGVSAEVDIPLGAASAPNCGICPRVVTGLARYAPPPWEAAAINAACCCGI